jgi:hypothetical protein
MIILYVIKNILYNKSSKIFNMKNVNGKILSRLSMVALVSLIFTASIAAMAIPAVKANGVNALYVDPPYQQITVCTNFTVRVNVSVTVPIEVVAFNLTFDPDLMECIDATNTSFPPNQSITVISLDNTAGWILVVIGATPPFMSGTVAEITFHCKGEGTGPLNFTDYAIELYLEDASNLPAELFNGTVNQIIPPVGGEVLTIDALALLVPWIAAAGAAVVAMALVLTSRRTLNH